MVSVRRLALNTPHQHLGGSRLMYLGKQVSAIVGGSELCELSGDLH